MLLQFIITSLSWAEIVVLFFYADITTFKRVNKLVKFSSALLNRITSVASDGPITTKGKWSINFK
jgi:hypothetical protein